MPVKVLFAPDHTLEVEFMKRMLKVKDKGEIWFAYVRRMCASTRAGPPPETITSPWDVLVERAEALVSHPESM